MLAGIAWHLRVGGGWRALPADFPPWRTVYGWFRRWIDTLQHFEQVLCEHSSRQAGRLCQLDAAQPGIAMTSLSLNSSLLAPLEAAHRLGITMELLFQYTKRSFAQSSGLRSLETAGGPGDTRFSVSELDDFDALLAGPWPSAAGTRARIPEAILHHLRAESQNRCARCGSGIAVNTAHIRPWATSRSHHHANLIRVCTNCHQEHDRHHSLSTEELTSLKAALVEQTRANLASQMEPHRRLGGMPRSTAVFVGREAELSDLIAALRSGRSALITGAGGVGKTELLVRALREAETGRPVLWIDVEQYSTATDVVSALRTLLGRHGGACPDELVPARLDALHACVVFDGIERAALDDIDELEDAIGQLFAATDTALFAMTSQVMLHRLPSEVRIRLGGLDQPSSLRLLKTFGGPAGRPGREAYDALLKFCDGHALTLWLASALINHYDGPSAALRAIEKRGVKAISLPGRRRQSKASSLELCLQLAYETVSKEARHLLWALAEAPAGLPELRLRSGWLRLPEPSEALAELRRWHLADIASADGAASRTRVLSPIRAFAVERARREERHEYETVMDRLVEGYAATIAFLGQESADPENTPTFLAFYAEETPNLLNILELAQVFPLNKQMVFWALSIVQSLMRHFFVENLNGQGARVMRDAAELALSSGNLTSASGLIAQMMALAQRAGATALLETGSALAGRLEKLTTDGGILADIALCRGMAASEAGDHTQAGTYARTAIAGYQARLNALGGALAAPHADGPDRDALHNDLSNAFGLLGSSLSALGRFEEAAAAYRTTLLHERGAHIAVNRGQAFHEIANCESHLGNFTEAANLYIRAAQIFLLHRHEGLSQQRGK